MIEEIIVFGLIILLTFGCGFCLGHRYCFRKHKVKGVGKNE